MGAVKDYIYGDRPCRKKRPKGKKAGPPKKHAHKWGPKHGGFFAGYTRSCTVDGCFAVQDAD